MILNREKKDLFDILNNIYFGFATAEDILGLAQIICYNNPYQSQYAIKADPKKLAIKLFKNNPFSKNDIALSYLSQKGADSAALNINDQIVKYKLTDMIDSISHELRHYYQAELIKESIINQKQLDKNMQEVVDSFQEVSSYQLHLSDLLKLSKFAQDQQLDLNLVNNFLLNNEKLHSKSSQLDYALDDERLKHDIDGYAYLQLKYEEDARLTALNFTLEFLNNLINDKDCPQHLKPFLNENLLGVGDNYLEEKYFREKPIYHQVQQAFLKSVELVRNASTQNVAEIVRNSELNPILKLQIAELKLFDLRKANIKTSTYFRAVQVFYEGRYEMDRSSYYYLKKDNPKKIMLDLYKEIYQPRDDGLYVALFPYMIYSNQNFIDPDKPMYFDSQELKEICFEWIKRGEITALIGAFFCEWGQLKNLAPDSAKWTFHETKKLLQNDEQLQEYINDKLSFIDEIFKKDINKINYYDYLLLKAIDLPNDKNIADLALIERISKDDCFERINNIKCCILVSIKLKLKNVKNYDIPKLIDKITEQKDFELFEEEKD